MCVLVAGLAIAAKGGGSHAKAPAAGAPRGASSDRALYARLSAAVMASYDSARGGFVRKDGTPCEAAIELALVRGREGDALAARRARGTLAWTRALLDTVGGGYVEGTKDLGVITGSLEKPTAVNARRLELLAMVARAPGGETAKRDGRKVAEYFDRILADPSGGWVTAQVGSRDLQPESNGLALVAVLRWAALSGDGKTRAFCERSLDRVWRDCRDPDLGMVRKDAFGEIHDPGLLADQAEYGRASLIAWQATGRDSDLVRAKAMAARLLERYEDAKKGGFREQDSGGKLSHVRIETRPFEDNARAARFLAEYGLATHNAAATAAGRRAWAAFEKSLEKPRLETAEWALAVRATWAGTGVERTRWSAVPTAPKTDTHRIYNIGRHRH